MSEGILARLLAAYAEEGFSISIGPNPCRESPNGCFAYLVPFKQQTSLEENIVGLASHNGFKHRILCRTASGMGILIPKCGQKC